MTLRICGDRKVQALGPPLYIPVSLLEPSMGPWPPRPAVHHPPEGEVPCTPVLQAGPPRAQVPLL